MFQITGYYAEFRYSIPSIPYFPTSLSPSLIVSHYLIIPPQLHHFFHSSQSFPFLQNKPGVPNLIPVAQTNTATHWKY